MKVKSIPIIAVCLALCALPVSANSAQMHWSGVRANGTIITDEACPLEVSHERLTFDAQEFPSNHYSDEDKWLTYSGSVRAEYTFYNPADYDVTATLAFPFGKLPDYGMDALSESYGITVNGGEVPHTLRHTYSESYSDFQLETDLPLLIDGYVEDAFYAPDTPVTTYTWKLGGTEESSVFTTWTDNNTRLLCENLTGYTTREKDIVIRFSTGFDKLFTVYVIGVLPEDTVWRFFADKSLETEITADMTLTQTKEMTFRQLAMRDYDPSSGVLEHDWYNAVVAMLNHEQIECGVLFRTELDISRSLLRWYEYELTVGAGEQANNTVTAPLYPSINSLWEPTIYGYTYLLSPAKSWADFGGLEIIVNTPYYMTESQPGGFEKTDAGYTLTLDGLPEGELTFTLSTSVNPKKSSRWGVGVPILIAAAVVIAGGVVLVVTHRKREE